MNHQSQQACDLQSVGGWGLRSLSLLLAGITLLAIGCPSNLWVGSPQDGSPAKIVHAVVFIILSRFHADRELLQEDGVSVKISHHLSKAGTQSLSYFTVLNVLGVETGWRRRGWEAVV